jgi:hypothetical protein
VRVRGKRLLLIRIDREDVLGSFLASFIPFALMSTSKEDINTCLCIVHDLQNFTLKFPTMAR